MAGEPPPENRVERALSVVKGLSVTNVLIIALIAVIAMPSYFAYRFMTDNDFRREFMTSAFIVDRPVPCVVLEGRRYGSQTRHTMLTIYGYEGPMEKIVGLRAPGVLTPAEIDVGCKRILAMAEELKK